MSSKNADSFPVFGLQDVCSFRRKVSSSMLACTLAESICTIWINYPSISLVSSLGPIVMGYIFFVYIYIPALHRLDSSGSFYRKTEHTGHTQLLSCFPSLRETSY